ncbi:YihY/virulence factor BrkB family protein [[Mycoplasma] falconis]|uniref:YihY/virulence factor BrkB family protein n=1 Tax=[Mycoplasma] falconis TaxID=92403 RepID=A0A501XCA9_9BACT|nr:YhjD/YihY/BrkB family envelope integrity protein [[Mycoplasma] falconis]TPE58079.1 YihY/virulence factor BrkB family protein [[Mycoplasma] falconis]
MGWRKKPKYNVGYNNDYSKKDSKTMQERVQAGQIITNKNKKNIVERVLKWIIYVILLIAIPRYLKSSKTKGREIVNSAYSKLNSNEFSFVPAGYALYLFLSFIPIITLVFGIIGSISSEYEAVLKDIILGQIIPGVGAVVPSAVKLWSSTGGTVAFILFTISVIWFASKGYSKMIQSMDALYGHKTTNQALKTRFKGFIASIIISILLTAVLLGFTAFTTFLIDKAGMGTIEKVVKDGIEEIIVKPDWSFNLVYWFTVILFLPIITYISFLCFFKFAPNFKLKFSQAHPGALVTSLPTSLFILIFGSLTSLIKYDKFGVVASFMYVILLLSFMSYFIYAGLIVNSSFYHIFINLPTVEKNSWWKPKNKIL